MSYPIIYDGLDINDGERFTVANLIESVGQRETDLITIPGRDGAAVGQNTMLPIVYTFDIVIGGATVEERTENLAILFGKPISGQAMTGPRFRADRARELILYHSATGYRLYQAIPSGGELHRNADSFTLEGVTLTCPDPTYTDQTGANYYTVSEWSAIPYDGTAPAYPLISLKNPTPGAGGRLTLRLQSIQGGDGDYTLEFVGFQAADKLIIDTATRTAWTEEGTPVIIYNSYVPTLTSDWPILEPLAPLPPEEPQTRIYELTQTNGTCDPASRIEWVTKWVG